MKTYPSSASSRRRSARLAANLFDEIIVDSFAGGGGASMGIEAALGRAVDVAVNHVRLAIEMHEANHPTTRHYCEDVWGVDPREGFPDSYVLTGTKTSQFARIGNSVCPVMAEVLVRANCAEMAVTR